MYDENKVNEIKKSVVKFIEDSEDRIKVAQQHLAKKVKEATVFNERLEESRNQITDAQAVINNFKAKIKDLQDQLQRQDTQEKSLQELLNQSIKSAESQVGKWEEKYFKMHEKWQKSDKRNKDLEKLEEKYHKMQSLLSNLGNYVSSPLTELAAKDSISTVTDQPLVTAEMPAMAAANTSPYETETPELFKEPNKVKNTLF